MVACAVSAVESPRDLLDRCVAGDAAAWRSLHLRYHQNALSVLRRLGVAPSQLEDACQEVFCDVFQYLPRFRHEADFRTWLYRICAGHARAARRRARVWSFLADWLPISGQSSGESLEEGQASRQLAKAIEQLSEAERVVFVLFELEGLSGKDIAEVIRRPQSTVFRRLHDARKRFAAVLEDAG